MRNFGSMEKYYRHFKGNVYRLVGIAKDSETLEEMVVYQAMYGEGQMWVRSRERRCSSARSNATASGCPASGSCPMRKP